MQFNSSEDYLRFKLENLKGRSFQADIEYHKAVAEYHAKKEIYTTEIDSIEAHLDHMDQLKEQTKSQVNEREGARVGPKNEPAPTANFHDTF